MDSYEWHFRLIGDEFDIDGLTELFGDEAKLVKDESGQTHLVMNLPLATNDSRGAQKAADELLAKLNAIAQIVHGNHENIQIGGVGCKDASGAPMHLFIHSIDAIRSRARLGVGLVITTSPTPSSPAPPPKLIGDQFLATADKDENLERALYLYGSLPLDWRGLYMVLEAAEDANGGERGLINKKWVPDGQIKAFKAAANSYKALRLAARHGTVGEGIDRASLTLDDARLMVRTILEKWIKSL